ncbi:MAG: hypothetical protein KGY81_08915 [Phycisphaerae bacterium]|nr:hypothetical protein [Phycisphaerae bacterium]
MQKHWSAGTVEMNDGKDVDADDDDDLVPPALKPGIETIRRRATEEAGKAVSR